MSHERMKVVVNDDGQHSIWPAERENPLGWHDLGFEGTKDECLDEIERVWTDLRPPAQRGPAGG